MVFYLSRHDAGMILVTALPFLLHSAIVEKIYISSGGWLARKEIF